MARTRLIVNADDYGLSPGTNAGIARAHREGIVTSASLMVRWPSARAAATEARSLPDLAVGLHVDLGEWTFEEGSWHELYRVVDAADEQAVRIEVRRQLEAFRDLLGRDPTHLDSHQHVHRENPAHTVVTTLGQRLGCPVRHASREIRYAGDFYGQGTQGEPYPEAVSVAALVALLKRLGDGTVELCCHPAAAADMDGMYRHERQVELATLCDPEVRDAVVVAGIDLLSFRDLR